MKNKFIAQKITAIQRYMPLGFLLLSAFNFICFASAAILENAQQITQNPLSDDPIAPRIIILAVVWGSIFIGSILVFLFPSPIVKGQASDKGGEVPPQDAGPSVPPKPDSKAVSDCPAPPCCAFGYLEVGFVMNGKRQEEKGHVKLYFTESKFSELQDDFHFELMATNANSRPDRSATRHSN